MCQFPDIAGASDHSLKKQGAQSIKKRNARKKRQQKTSPPRKDCAPEA
ncbi:hypothetical protein [uncultured Bartonella sp.]|nr:hypothetical protein [uncultured Bartonella sp.]